MAELHLDRIGKVFPNGTVALEDLTLQVAQGERIVVVGPSGAGKTTLLRIVAGLEDPSSGQMRLNGQVINDWPPSKRSVAMVFQRHSLYPHVTVRENLGFTRRLHSQCPDGAPTIGDIARWLELEHCLDRKPSELSGGEQQRAAVGRAVASHKSILLLDEPLSNLDPSLRAALRRQLLLLQFRLRPTMLYVTHDQFDAMTLAERMVVMRQGRVEQIGRPNEVYNRPTNRFVAGFIGWPPMSFIEGQVTKADGQLQLECTDWKLPLAATTIKKAEINQVVTVGCRPEDVILDDRTKSDCSLRMTVALTEMLGAGVLVMLRSQKNELAALVPQSAGLRSGMPVIARLNVNHLHFFDAQTGASLHLTG